MQQPRRLAIVPHRSAVDANVCGHGEGCDAQRKSAIAVPIVDAIGSNEQGTGAGYPSGKLPEVGGPLHVDGGHFEPKVHMITGGRRYRRKLALSLHMELAIKAQEKENGHVFHIANITECQPSTH